MKERHKLYVASMLHLALAACEEEDVRSVDRDAGMDAGLAAMDAGVDAGPRLACTLSSDCPQPGRLSSAQPVVAVCCYNQGEYGLAPRCSAITDAGVCGAPAVLDPRPSTDPLRCPDLVLARIAHTSPSCCTSDGWCGSDSTLYGLGCRNNSDPAFRALLLQTFPQDFPDASFLPPIRRCDSTLDGGLASDGGV